MASLTTYGGFMKLYANIIVILSLLLFAAYERGWRVADLGDVPHSKRPVSLFVTGGV